MTLKMLLAAILLVAVEEAVAQEVGGENSAATPPVITNAPAEKNIQTDTAASVAVPATTPPVNIARFEVVGNTLLSQSLIDDLLSPYKGDNKTYTDINHALEALEGAYRDAGYNAVNVTTPEQDITDGVVVFNVSQAVLNQILIEDNRFYDEANIKNALPALTANTTPNARQLAQNLRLANENPTRNIEVVLAMGDEENKVDAKVKVKDQSPRKVFATLDNTGNQSTGDYRTGIGYQHNNLFNRDQAFTFNYLTSPDHVKQVTQLSGSYRLPIYPWGDSMDMSVAYSNTDAGTTTVGGAGGPILYFTGQGRILSWRYNHYLPLRGESASKLSLRLDHRAFTNNCLINGAAICGGAGENLTLHPVTISYDTQITKPGMVIDYAASLEHNLPFGSNGTSASFGKIRPGTQAGYNVLRTNGSLVGAISQDWQYRVAGNAQYVSVPVIAQESFGLVGANSVRGFHERELFSGDRGYLVNAELYAADIAGKLKLEDSSLRPLLFVDFGGSYGLAASSIEKASSNAVTSAGAGLRFTWHKNLVAKLDVARVVSISNNPTISPGRWFGHFGLVSSW